MKFIFSPLTIKPISNTIPQHRDSIEVMIPRGGGEIIYKFKEHPKLVREIVRLDPSTQTELNDLIQDLVSNNLNSGIQIEPVDDLTKVFKVSSPTQATVFFREQNNTLEILGQAGDLNQTKVIDLLKEYGY